MLATIEELEKEISQFHRNVKDSNELMHALTSVASLSKSQTAVFDARTIALQEDLAKLPPELADLFQNKIEDFVRTVHQEHQSYQVAITKALEAYTDTLASAQSALASMPSALDAQLQKDHAENVTSLKLIQAQYAAELANQNDQFAKQLESSYNSFITKLEATNMDQLYKYCQDMNRAVNTKLRIALGGISIAVIVSIVSLFI